MEYIRREHEEKGEVGREEGKAIPSLRYVGKSRLTKLALLRLDRIIVQLPSATSTRRAHNSREVGGRMQARQRVVRGHDRGDARELVLGDVRDVRGAGGGRGVGRGGERG